MVLNIVIFLFSLEPEEVPNFIRDNISAGS